MKLNCKILCCLLLFSGIKISWAQEAPLSVSAGGGVMYYLGDLTDKNLPSFKQMNRQGYLALNYKFSNLLYGTFGFVAGRVSGADSLTSKKDQRDYHFRTPITDFHVLLGLNLQTAWLKIFGDDGIKDRFDDVPLLDGPKFIFGGGLYHFNPKAFDNGKWKKLQPLGTEGQNIGEGYDDPYARWQFNVKFGGEIGFRLNKHVQLDLFAVYNVLFTDYLDDVSGQFPDYNALLKTDKGRETEKFTYKLKQNYRPEKGAQRGNSAINDSYTYLGIKLTYTISKAQFDQLRHQ